MYLDPRHTDVAVIIPTYNRAGLIGRAIRSVLSQTYNRFELIIVDDCSIDNTEEVVRGFGDDRIRYIRREANKGVSAARNIGIRNTESKYLTFLDDDDELLSGYLEKQLAAITKAKKTVGVAYADMLTEYGQTITRKEGNVHKDVMRLQFNCQMECFLIKSECFKSAGLFDEDLPFAEDVDMIIRLSKTFNFIHVDEPLVIRNLTGGSLMSNMDSFINGFESILKKHYEEFKLDRKALSQFYLHIGHFLYIKGDLKAGRRYLFEAAISDPLNIKAVGASLLLSLDKKRYDQISQIYMNLKYRQLKR
ncbi:MAG: glycosyltransferase family 2 protein [Dehalococcoidia bacterium]